MPIEPRGVKRIARCRAFTLAVLSAVFCGCQSSPVQWVDEGAVVTDQPSPLAQSPYVPIDSTMSATDPLAVFQQTQDLLRETGARSLLLVHLDSMAESQEQLPIDKNASSMQAPPISGASSGASAVPDTGESPSDSLRCARSLRVASSPGRGAVAVWWSRRAGGRVALLASRRDSTAGGRAAWQASRVVDSADRGPATQQALEQGTVGCARPAPHVAIDSRNGFVHVVYSINGANGPGIFYAHQMDPRAGFEVAQGIVFGARLGAARVASDGDLVAIAYEDPNGGERPSIGLAVSRSGGHMFDDRLVASTASAGNIDPYVTVKGRAIVVGWSERAGSGVAPTLRIRRARVR